MAGQFFSHWRDHRAFKRLSAKDRQIVLFSESAQDWHHFAPIVDELVNTYGRTICYVASEAADPGLHRRNERILPFCVGAGFFRILWFQTLEAGVLLTQLLDLNNLDLKRSVHPVHYVYMFHSLISTHMADHENSYDHYDTILCAGPHQAREIRRREELAQLPAKQLLPHGYHRVEQLMAERRDPPPVTGDADIHVLLAPSWGERTILNLFGAELVDTLLQAGFRLTLRPHFQTRWNTPEVIDRIVAAHADHPQFSLVEQMAESDSLFDSHVMITDWSGAGMDYAFGLEKPVLYFDMPPKSRNDAWKQLGIEPFEAWVRTRIGALLAPERVADAPDAVRRLVADPAAFRADMIRLRAESIYNLGHSAQAAAEAVVRIADGQPVGTALP